MEGGSFMPFVTQKRDRGFSVFTPLCAEKYVLINYIGTLVEILKPLQELGEHDKNQVSLESFLK